MSLLMNALKKAEETKRKAEDSAPNTASAAVAELSLEPVAAPITPWPPGSPLPELSQHLDSVDAELARVSIAAAARRSTSAGNRPAAPAAKPAPPPINSVEAVRNVFAVKQTPRSRTGFWLLPGLAGIAAVGIGAYFGWPLQDISGSLRSQPPSNASAPSMPSMHAVAPTVSPTTTAPPAPPEATAAPLPPPRPPAREAALPSRTMDSAQPKRPLRQAAAAATPAAPEETIHLSTSRSEQNPILNRAYESLQAEKLNDARRDYEQVLRSDPKNIDALLGLAMIAGRQGDTEQAAALYLRVLEADPKDATAQAAIINTKGQSDPALSESRLKTLLASQPESPALNFALGNTLARQARWGEAQQAYFKAYTGEPENADYLFNLAVSLDHLHQNKLAAHYYQIALTIAGQRSSSFDKNQVKSRLLELQS